MYHFLGGEIGEKLGSGSGELKRRFGDLKNCCNFGATNVKKGLKVIRVQNTQIKIRRGK